jgi:hypothetical protein
MVAVNCKTRANTWWNIRTIAGAYRRVTHVRSKKVMEASGTSHSHHIRIYPWTSSHRRQQLWTFEDREADGTSIIRDKRSNKCASVWGHYIRVKNCGNFNDPYIQWKFRAVTVRAIKPWKGEFEIRNPKSRKCIGTHANQKHNGAYLALRHCAVEKLTEWRVEKINKRWIRIRNVKNGYVFHVYGGQTHNNVRIQNYSWNGQTYQHFKLSDSDGDGENLIINKRSNKCISVRHHNRINEQIVQKVCNNKDWRQHWIFTPINRGGNLWERKGKQGYLIRHKASGRCIVPTAKVPKKWRQGKILHNLNSQFVISSCNAHWSLMVYNIEYGNNLESKLIHAGSGRLLQINNRNRSNNSRIK